MARAFLIPSLLPLFVLCGCAGAQNIHAVKSDDYTKIPQRVLFSLPVQAELGDPFKIALADALAKCGTTVQFTTAYNIADAKTGHFDAIMRSASLGQETTTTTSRYSSSSYVNKVRFEFALVDAESQKNVWKEQIDFTNDDPMSHVSHASKEGIWAAALVDTMVKNKLVGACDASHAVPVAAPLAYASPNPIVPAGQAAPGTPAKPSTITYTVGGTVYNNADAALEALHAQTDKNVALTTPTSPQAYEPLLFVMPTPEEIEQSSFKITGIANEADLKKYQIGLRQIQYEGFIQAFRKNSLFKTVAVMTSDRVKPGDFLGNGYKLWFVKPEGKGAGSWVLASAKGGEQRFQLSGADKNDMQGMLVRTKAALEQLPK